MKLHRLGSGVLVALLLSSCASAAIDDQSVDTAAAVATAAPLATTSPVEAPAAVEQTQPTPVALPSAAPSPLPTATAAPEPTAEVAATAVPESTSPPAAESVTEQPTAAPAPAPTAVPAPPASNDSLEIQVANGAEVYTLECARCHGQNGTGEIYSGLIGVGSKYTTAGMINELTNGHPVTFGFADRLSADEIASVAAYVKATFP